MYVLVFFTLAYIIFLRGLIGVAHNSRYIFAQQAGGLG